MTKVNLCLLLLAGTASGSLIASAQTTTHHTATSTVHHPAAAAAKPASPSDCVTEPTLSPSIPAVPADTGCPKSMVSISENIQLSPLVSPELRAAFPSLETKFSLDYQDLAVGTGAPAQPHMYYTVKYTGYLLDGTKFDASDDHPETKNGISFPYGGRHVIPGWDMGFEGMHIGGKRRLFIPYQLAYGERGRPPIPPKAELVFDMELVAQSATDPNAPPVPPASALPGQPGAVAPGAVPPAQPQTTSPQAAPGPATATPPPATTTKPQSSTPQ